MTATAFPQAFPAPKTPLVDKDGIALKDGRYLWLALWQRSGQGDGIVPMVTGFNPSQNANPLVATGNSQATALALSDDWNNFGTVAAGAGCIMQLLKPGQDLWIWNNGANSLNVFPFLGGNIDAGIANAAQVLAAGKLRYYQCWTQTQIVSSAVLA